MEVKKEVRYSISNLTEDEAVVILGTLESANHATISCITGTSVSQVESTLNGLYRDLWSLVNGE